MLIKYNLLAKPSTKDLIKIEGRGKCLFEFKNKNKYISRVEESL